jgi:hypothetical protein
LELQGLFGEGFVPTRDTTAALNATITKCGLLLEPPGGIIPAGATVVFATNVAI